jgi:methyl-accepting chemotaxis protein
VSASVDGHLVDIVKTVGEARRMVERITLASQEQAGGIEQCNVAMSQVDQATQQSAAAAEEASAAAEELAGSARDMAELVARFRVNGGKSTHAPTVHRLPAAAPAFADSRSSLLLTSRDLALAQF